MNFLEQWFPASGNFAPKDVWQCMVTLWVVPARHGGGRTCHQHLVDRVQCGILLSILQYPGQIPTTKNYSAKNAKSTTVEELCSRMTILEREKVEQNVHS